MLISLFGSAVSFTPARANSAITVNTTADEDNTGADCSLREVITAASTTAPHGSCVASLTIFRLGEDTAKKQYHGLLSFSAKGLPDNAVITKVTLKVKKQGISGGWCSINFIAGKACINKLNTLASLTQI